MSPSRRSTESSAITIRMGAPRSPSFRRRAGPPRSPVDRRRAVGKAGETEPLAASAPPRPSSATSIRKHPFTVCTSTEAVWASACFATFVSASATMK